MAPAPELLTGLGAAFSIFLASAGSAVASVQGGKFLLKSTGILSFAPIVISGVLAIYGIIVSVILGQSIQDENLDQKDGYRYLSAGLSVGLACLASGIGLARFLEDFMTGHAELEGLEGSDEEPLMPGRRSRQRITSPSIRFLMILCFLEAIGLYGLIVALVLMS